jgi:hypothetical protein
MKFSRVTCFIALNLAIAPVHAQQCVGFADVSAGSAFCASVEWIKNRGITLGCTANEYCPNQPVLRSQMALFMNRLGTVLTARQLWTEANWGAVDLDGSSVICQTQDYSVTGYPRRALVDLAFSGLAGGSVEIAADLVLSTNGGSTWTQMTTLGNRGSMPANKWGNVANLANADLNVGQVVRFAVRVSRISGAANLSSSRCNLRVSIESRDGTGSPL